MLARVPPGLNLPAVLQQPKPWRVMSASSAWSKIAFFVIHDSFRVAIDKSYGRRRAAGAPLTLTSPRLCPDSLSI